MRGPLAELARAKVNLTLRVIGARADGYHDIESLVAFAHLGDRLTLAPGPALDLVVRGRYAAMCGPKSGNLVLRAARALRGQVEGLRLGCFRLEKNLPAAAGLGGGSADAAAALRLLAKANKLKRSDPRLYVAARATGADVPVCLEQRTRIMGGIGDELGAPLALSKLHAVLVNPGRQLATKDVFEEFDRQSSSQADHQRARRAERNVLSLVFDGQNDLEPAAISLQRAIADVLAALRAQSGCQLVRMSGAGATCFGLFTDARAATTAARSLRARHANWWVRADVLGG